MVKLKKRKNDSPQVNAGSMADISFLLLLFFLVSTNIDVDTGIGLVLPEYQEDNTNVAKMSKDRMASLLVNENGDVLLDKNVIAIPQIKDNLKERIKSKISLPSNKKLVVSVKTDRKTVYNLYIQTLDQVKGAFFEVQEEYAKQTYGKSVDELTPEEKKDVDAKIPIIISIAEPEQV